MEAINVMLKNARLMGVKIKHIPMDNQKEFWLIFIPVGLMCQWLKKIKVRMPIYDESEKTGDDPDEEKDEKKKKKHVNLTFLKKFRSKSLLTFFFPCFTMLDKNEEGVAKVEAYRHNAVFDPHMFEVYENTEELFVVRNAVRSAVANRIMQEVHFSPDDDDKGLAKAESTGIITTYYPPHQETYAKPGPIGVRHYLEKNWAQWSNILKFQPLVAIKYYFGEAHASYYAFYGFYIKMLVFPAVLSVVVLIYNLINLTNTAEYREMCDPFADNYVGNLPVCPLCDECDYTKMSLFCEKLQLSKFFDNYASTIFGVFFTFWIALFVKYFRRKIAELRYFFDMGLDNRRDPNELKDLVDDLKFGKLGALKTPYNAAYKDGGSRLFTLFVIKMWVWFTVLWVVLLGAFNAVMISREYPALVALDEWADRNFVNLKVLLAVITYVIYFFINVLLNYVWEKFSLWLTNRSRPHSAKKFVESYTWKIFCMTLVNNFAYFYYIALIKPVLAGRPALNYYYFLFFRWENCAIPGCMDELSYLLVFCVAQRFILTLVAYNKPKFSGSSGHCWSADYGLIDVSDLDIHARFARLVADTGFVFFFIAAHPYAPLFALPLSLLSLRMEAQLQVRYKRRPLVRFLGDIGTWFHMVEVMGLIAVVSNAVIVAFSTQTMLKYFYHVHFWYFNQEGRSKNETGLMEFTLSRFPSVELIITPETETIEECYYRGFRYAPEHPQKYEATLQWWEILGTRLFFLIAVGFAVIAFNFLITPCIPNVNRKVDRAVKQEKQERDDIIANYPRSRERYQERLSKHADLEKANPIFTDIKSYKVQKPPEPV